MMTHVDEPTHLYPIDIENPVELARLIDQGTLLTQAMGGLLPDALAVPAQARILDLACGPGSWVLDMAYAYPESEVAGVDISQSMIAYANTTAKTHQRHNVTFGIMDIVSPLDFSDATFDLINARLLAGVVFPKQWPALLGECLRVLKPGGILCLTELEGGSSNSRGLQYLSQCLYRAFRQQGRSFSVDGHSLGIVPMQATLLRQAGFTNIQQQPFLLDACYEAPSHLAWLHNIRIVFTELKPYLVSAGVVSSDVFDDLFSTMLIEMYQEQFVCLAFGLTTWGSASDRSKEGGTPP